jgi:pilus assembly protein CpaB
MKTARIVVLTIAVGAGGIAAHPANGSDGKLLPTGPVAQLQTVDVATPGTGPGRSITPDDLQIRRAATANDGFIRPATIQT